MLGNEKVEYKIWLGLGDFYKEKVFHSFLKINFWNIKNERIKSETYKKQTYKKWTV